MAKEFNVAIAGATGAVGVEMLKTLEQRQFPVKKLRLLASKRSAGKTMTFRGEEIVIEELTHDSFEGMDIALFSAGGDISREYRDVCRRAGCVMIDNSSAFRMDDDVPLVIPEVNPEDVKWHNGVIANPNCCTAILLVTIFPLHKVNPIKRIVIDTYQAASGAGAKAMEELELTSAAVLRGEEVEPKHLAHRLAFNLFPHVDKFQENGYTKEEMKFVGESRKIMHCPDLRISATCVRVPVLRAHSEAVHIEFTNPMTPEEAREILRSAPGVQVVDDPANNLYPMPLDATCKYDCLIGRIRQDISFGDNALAVFVAGDQLLKGAALNAVQIAELL